MLSAWEIIIAAFLYIGVLFAVAYYGDIQARRRKRSRPRPNIYALSLAVYCTSWTFFGSVGLSAATGLDFLAVYIGPVLMFTLGLPLIRRVIRLSKAQNITSIADFIGARYGKNPAVAALVTIVAVAGVIPYIALQLQAVAQSVSTLLLPLGSDKTPTFASLPIGDIGFIIAVIMSAFAILFGTRHTDATEHQEGLMLAIATESVVKIAVFMAAGAFVTFYMFGGLTPAAEAIAARPHLAEQFSRMHGGTLLTVTFLSAACILLLPRQFHVTIVENNAPEELDRASWLFPLYLAAINLFVVPIAAAGVISFGADAPRPDMFVLELPISAGSSLLTVLAFLGGLSAATAMVIVDTVALSIMVGNDLVMPVMLRRRAFGDHGDVGGMLLHIRRLAIAVILMLAYLFYRGLGNVEGLATIGLLSFAAIAQFAPAFFGGLMWRRATARGAMAGIVAGFAVWAYTLLLPFFVKAGFTSPYILDHGPFGLWFLRPQMLFFTSFDPLTHGLVWSMTANVTAYVMVSLTRPPEAIERLQANAFIGDGHEGLPAAGFGPWRTPVKVEELQKAVGRYLGSERTEHAFREFARSRALVLSPQAGADPHLLRFAENLLASAIGAASSRLVMSLTLRRRNVGMKSAMKLLDDASEAIQFNRDMLESALDQVRQGIAVFDKDMRLICWNRQLREILELPAELVHFGARLEEIVRHTAGRSELYGMSQTEFIADRFDKYAVTMETFIERFPDSARVIEIRTNVMPQGGIVTTYTDITQRVAAADALARANETLEGRVKERTAELAEAKSRADEANLDKTRFLAAASHDVLQPLNAARLYTTSLIERRPPAEAGRLARNIDASLEAVEEIMNALLDISRLDAGVMKPELSVFSIGDMLKQLKLEFDPMAQERGLRFTVVPSSLHVRSDRKFLRRLLQNLVSNAIKYTAAGGVAVGCRRRGGSVRIEIWDSGSGIPANKHQLIFKEFQRLDTNAHAARGLGLGLSIVERIARMLAHPVELSSKVGRGSVFSVTLPRARASDATAAGARPPVRTFAADLSGCTVLCIDNEPAVLDGMATLLDGWKCTVLRAQNIAQAVAVTAHGDRPDIILADYHLSNDEIGLEAVARVRQAAGAGIQAVIITADQSLPVQDKVRAAGLTMLRKPVKPASLRALLTQLRLRQAAAE